MKNFILTILTCLSVSCAHQETVANIYQPKVLILLPKTVIKTKEGIYTTSSKEEVWHSQETVDKLEKELSQF